jgi:hypothetical protein
VRREGWRKEKTIQPHETRRTFVVEQPFFGPASPPGPVVIDCGKGSKERREDEEIHIYIYICVCELASLFTILLFLSPTIHRLPCQT